MGTLQEITATVSQLPELLQGEVLDFARFLARKQAAGNKLEPEEQTAQRKSLLLARLERFQIDMSSFRFDREEANARR